MASTLRCIEKRENLEVIVVDNLSHDNTLEIAQNAGFNCISEPDSGQSEAINKGIKRSSGDIIGFLNADDIFFPKTLSRVREVFSSKPDLKVIYGQGTHIDEWGNWLEDYTTQSWDYSALKSNNYLCQPAVFWRREIHEEFGYFDEDLHYAFDYEFWLRLGKRLPFLYLEYEYLAKSRLHSEAKTVKFPLEAKWENLLVKQRHNQWIDTKSAFGYCALLSNNQTDEEENPALYAELFLTGMQKVDSHFDVQDFHAWKTVKKEMKRMASISKPSPSGFSIKAKILVDLTLFGPGGVHGGIKPAVYSLLHEIQETRKCTLILIISIELQREVEETFGELMDIEVLVADEKIQDRIAQHLPDLVFSPLPSIRFYQESLPFVFLAPDLLHIDYPGSLTDAEIAYRHNLFSEASEKADVFLTVSNYSRNRLVQAYGIPHRNVWVIPHALPRERTFRNTRNDSNENPYFLYPANFWTHKNHKTLLIAYKSYLRQIEDPWKLVLTGHPDSGDSEAILKLIHLLGLEEFVEYKGFLNGLEYDAVWADAKSLIFPSSHEGFGLPILEAMNCGIPIIASDLASLREVAGDAAFFVDQSSPASISQAMCKISKDEKVRQFFAGKGLQRIKNYNWQESTNTFLNLVSNLLREQADRTS